MNVQEVRGTKVTLRALKEAYFDEYCAMFSPKVRNLLHVTSLQAERVYLCECCTQQKQQTMFFYCIFSNKNQKLIGAIAIRDREQYQGQLYSWLHEHYWSTGCYQEALTLITQVYFAFLDDLFFTAHVDVTNKRSYYALKKYGFADSGMRLGACGWQYQLVLRRTDSL